MIFARDVTLGSDLGQRFRAWLLIAGRGLAVP
jgi:hypothetical protein